ncbi:uncharacterized protein LOC129596527 [Paramacrobiotus metropolitanus]|uniref:uncharacterized protein LOC129596527 n=1 Tax=Paramacrobiotus metropolitanus TaxID=2943436 RepID=UPI0024463D1F|nr:uncharacterized protein LOC129596527 [Paramacrobiotus metropolitanus]
MAGNGAKMGTGHMIGLGAGLCVCGLLLIILDIVFFALYIPITGSTGIIFGIFYIITGAITIAAGKTTQANQDNARCLMIAALVLSILSLLDAFGMLIFAILLTILWPVVAVVLVLHVLVLAICVGVIVVMAGCPALHARTTQTMVVTHLYAPQPTGGAPPGYTTAETLPIYPTGQFYPVYPQQKV